MAAFLTDLVSDAKVVALINPDTYTTTQTGTGVDMQLTDGPITAILQVKSHDFTTGNETLAVKLQESDTVSGSYTDVTNGAFATIAADAASVQVIKSDLRTKRWVRALGTFAGTTPSTLFSVLLIARKKITGSGAGVQL